MRFIPNIPQFGGGGGPPPPPPSSQDRFAPKFLVGNTQAPFSDSAVAYSSAGFRYIPDVGDGEGIRTALAAAAAAAPFPTDTRGDVYIRPGTYTLAADALPLQIPANVRVQGAGQSTIVRRSGTNQYCCVFALASESELRDVQISVFNSSATLLDQGVLIVSHQTINKVSYLERVNVGLTNNVDAQFKIAAIRVIGGALVADRCEISVGGFSAGDPRISDFGVAGVRIEDKSQAYFDACKIDVATFFGASAKSPAILSGYTDGQLNSGGGLINIDQCAITGRGVPAIIGFGTDLRMTASFCGVFSDGASDAAAIYLRDSDDERSKVSVCNNSFQVPGPGTPFETYGIDVDVEQGRIVGNEILAANGIVSRNAAGKGVAIGFNNVTSQAGKHISVQPVDESAHNILSAP